MREVTVGKPKSAAGRPVEKRGGYAAGKKLVTELKPPPAGPAPGAKRGERRHVEEVASARADLE